MVGFVRTWSCPGLMDADGLADYAAAAAQSLDLTGVLAVLDSFRKVAEITQRHGVEAHTRMLGG